MSKFTPGPWNYHAQGDANESVLLTNEKRWVIAFRQNGELLTPEQEANARLIAAAPEMYELLKRAAESLLEAHYDNDLVDDIDHLTSKLEESK